MRWHTKHRASGHRRRAGPSRPAPPPVRRAFSLAEMMIALIILGFGLLVVGAALPIGYRYTEQTVDRATGDATVANALDLIEQRVRLCQSPFFYNEATGTTTFTHYADLFEPRVNNTGLPAKHGHPLKVSLIDPTDPDSPFWEPIIKVRPLLAMAIDATSGGTDYGDQVPDPQSDVENRIMVWLQSALGLTNRWYQEYDDYRINLNWMLPPVTSIDAVYPPISPDAPFRQADFFSTPYARTQVSTPAYPPGSHYGETRKAMDERIVWTAFYRRASYATGSDPDLYEVIAVALRLPTANHRFPRFNPMDVFPTGLTGQAGGGATTGYSSKDTLAPVPWLMTFKTLPPLIPNVDYELVSGDRNLNPSHVDPADLRFVADAATAALLPPGSIFIPAVNDNVPTAIQPVPPGPVPVRSAGFVPHAPNTLPIYEVVRTEDIPASTDRAIVVKNNGFYPWVDEATSKTALNWPVWVIPPAYASTDGSGQPVFERRSPIVAVGRRFIRFREVP